MTNKETTMKDNNNKTYAENTKRIYSNIFHKFLNTLSKKNSIEATADDFYNFYITLKDHMKKSAYSAFRYYAEKSEKPELNKEEVKKFRALIKKNK